MYIALMKMVSCPSLSVYFCVYYTSVTLPKFNSFAPEKLDPIGRAKINFGQVHLRFI